MKLKFKEVSLGVPALFAALYAVHYIFLVLSVEYTECLTASICLNSHDHIILLSFVYTVTRLMLIACAGALVFALMYTMKKRLLFITGGIVCFILSTVSMALLLMLTPPEEMNQYIHIIVISVLVGLLGLFFIYAQFKKRS